LKEYIDSKKEEMLQELEHLIMFKSISEETENHEAPFGEECKKALEYVLSLGEKLGFRTKNIDGYCGYIEMGEGEEMVGIIGHLDVVPANMEDGWKSNPFIPEIREGKLYGRGAIDDKGPIIASLYAMKAVQETMKINKRVRLILGLNEEKNWKCIHYYKQREEAPTIGFSPDADFPCIYAEKGIITVKLDHEFYIDNCEILEVSTGDNAINVVPKYCMMRLKLTQPEEMERFQNTEEVHVERISKDTVKLVAYGKAAHAAHPKMGENAIIKMLKYLKGNWYIDKLEENGVLELESPKAFGGEDTADESGVLTSNIAKMKYAYGRLKLYTNLRVPVNTNLDEIQKCCEILKTKIPGLEYGLDNSNTGLYVAKDSYLVKTLTNIFNEETGLQEEPIAIGGGTYARAFKNCVSFGMNMPGDPDMCHQVDEFIDIEKWLLGTKIYARAIYELAK